MKKVISLLALVAVFAFAGCNKKRKEDRPRGVKKEHRMHRDHEKRHHTHKDHMKKNKKMKKKPCKGADCERRAVRQGY